jgi:hypothetical protein
MSPVYTPKHVSNPLYLRVAVQEIKEKNRKEAQKNFADLMGELNEQRLVSEEKSTRANGPDNPLYHPFVTI